MSDQVTTPESPAEQPAPEPAAADAIALAGPKKTPQAWAEEKQIGLRTKPGATAKREKAARDMVLDGAVVHNRWAVGLTLTEADFEKGLADYLGVPLP